MNKKNKNQASGIVDLMLLLAAGAAGFAIINGITLLLTSKQIIIVPIFIISAILCFIIWPMDRMIENDLKNLGKGE